MICAGVKTKALDRLGNYLAKKIENKRNTQQRQLITECVHLLDHPTAEDVWRCVVKKLPNVNKTTIYRNLNRMVEERELLSFVTGSGITHFDSNVGRHYHLYCESCGKISDASAELFNQITKTVLDSEKFTIKEQKLTFTGICSECQYSDG